MSDGQSDVKWWHTVLALVLVAVGVVSALWIIRAAVRTFLDLDNAVATAIVTVSGTVLVAVLSVLITRAFERRRDRETAQRQKQSPVYEEFIAGVLDLIGATRPPDARGEATVEEVYEIFSKFTERLVVWGSDDVIKAWVNYRYRLMQQGEDSEQAMENMFLMETLFLQIRRDLGLRNKRLRRGDLLRMWINDLPIPDAK